jgi:hypothetical protein
MESIIQKSKLSSISWRHRVFLINEIKMDRRREKSAELLSGEAFGKRLGERIRRKRNNIKIYLVEIGCKATATIRLTFFNVCLHAYRHFTRSKNTFPARI